MPLQIKNESSPHTVKLSSRRWLITDANGKQHEVRGPGVVGEQPELAMGQSFTYTSSCPMAAPRGSMVGHFEFYKQGTEGRWTTSFLVQVAEFGMDAEERA